MREWQCSCDVTRRPVPVVERSAYLEAIARAEMAEAECRVAKEVFNADHSARLAAKMNAALIEQLTAMTNERDSANARIAEAQCAMHETGAMVRSLYVGSEVSKRILNLTEKLVDMTKERDNYALALEVALRDGIFPDKQKTKAEIHRILGIKND